MTYESLQRTITAKRILIKILIVLLATALVTTAVLVYMTLRARAAAQETLQFTQNTAITYDGAPHVPDVTVSIKDSSDTELSDEDKSHITIRYAETEIAANAPEETGSETIPAVTTAGVHTIYYRAIQTVAEPDPIVKVGSFNVTVDAPTPQQLTLTWDSTTSWAYDGNNHAPAATLSGILPEHAGQITVSVTGEASADIGSYTATATISIPDGISSMYVMPTNLTQTYTITTIPLTLTWSNTSFTYDGTAHKPTATLSGILSGDAISVNVSGEQTNIGSYNATAAITGSSEVLARYTMPTNTTQEFAITKANLTLTWGSTTSWVHDGQTHKPTATLSGLVGSDALTVSVSGESSEVGSHTATATINGETAVKANYNMPSNLTQSFTIRAANIGTFYPSAKSVSVDYNGQEQTVDLGMQESSLTKTVEGVVYTLSGLTASATGKDAGNHEGTITGTAVIRDASGNDCTDQFTVSIPTNSGNLTIRPKSIANATIKLENDGKLYFKKGTSQMPKVVSVTVDGMTVPSDAYTVNCTPQTDVNYGYTLSVSANSGGNFSGTATTSWEIKENSKDVTNPTVVTSGGKKSGSSYSSGSRSGSSYSSSSSSSGSGSRGSYGSTSSSGGGYYDADGNWVEDESVEGDGGIILTAEEVLRYVEISFDKENGQTSDGTAINAPTIKVASIKQAAQAILSEEAKQAIREDKHVSIKITTKAIEAEPTEDEKAAMESGIRNYSDRLPGLTKGMYMDIAIETSIDGGPWQQTTVTTEPVQFIIDVPSDLQKLADTFYVMRIHDGECTLLYDRDKDPATVTVETQLFSTYVMMYQDEEAAMAEGAGTLSATENRTAVSGAGTEKKYWVILYIYLTAILGVGIAILVLQVREMSWKDSLYAQRRPERAMAQPQQQPRNKEKLAGVQA